MQSVDPNAGAARSERGPLSPVVAFALLLGVLAMLGTIVALTRPDTSTRPTTTTSESTDTAVALTNEEAIARFEELNEMRFDAFSARDPSLVSRIYTADSRVSHKVSAEIRTLIREQVLDKSIEVTLSTSVVSNSPSEIRIREVARVTPQFVSERGRTVTSDSRPVVATRIWILRQQEEEWLVYDAIVKRARKIDS